MSSLRSVFDELPLDELGSLSDDELAVRVDELERAARLIGAERARCLVEVERRGMHLADGQLSAGAWLAHRHGIPQGAAAAHVQVARALVEMPRATEALREGEISGSAVEALVRTRDAAPEAFAQEEEVLVDSAKALSYRDLRVALDRWHGSNQWRARPGERPVRDHGPPSEGRRLVTRKDRRNAATGTAARRRTRR